jgi:serine/threonine protein kinase
MGARLGRYVVLKHLASGGMADVLLGRADGHSGFERHVVLKRIRADHAGDQRFIRMFLDEARVAANLHHQHVVQVHDVGETGGEYFIAMEYIHGEDVRTILSAALRARQHVPLGYAIAIVSAAAAGLHYAHERRGPDKRPLGIVHRDISPSNILVGYDGSIKVVDFGIAKAEMRQETKTTRSGSGRLKGKVAYMSPEQCKSGDIDRRSDVYSLGVVLYELCTTTKLFRGENDYLIMDQIVNGKVALPRVRRPELPNEISAIIMRAIAPDPERRFATADELRLALDHFAAKGGLTASTSSIAAYMRKQFGEKPEPWLERTASRVSKLPVSPAGTQPGQPDATGWRQVWVAEPRSGEVVFGPGDMARGSGSDVVRSSGSDVVRGSGEFPPPVVPIGSGAVLHTTTERSVSKTTPTDSKMGWESQASDQAPRLGWPKLVLVAPAVIMLLGGLSWLALSNDGPEKLVPAPPPEIVTTQAPRAPEAPPPAPIAAAPATTEAPAPAAAPTAQVPRIAASAPTAIADRAPAGTESPAHETDVSDAKRSKKAQSKIVESLTAPQVEDAARPAAPAAPPSSETAHAAAAPRTEPTNTLLATLPANSEVSAAPAAAPAPPSPSPSGIAAAPSASPAATPATPPVADALPPQLTHAAVDRVAAVHTRELSKCEFGEDLHGEVTVRFLIDDTGKVITAQVQSTLNKPKVAACILRSVQKWQFPPQHTIGAQGTYTLAFQ